MGNMGFNSIFLCVWFKKDFSFSFLPPPAFRTAPCVLPSLLPSLPASLARLSPDADHHQPDPDRRPVIGRFLSCVPLLHSLKVSSTFFRSEIFYFVCAVLIIGLTLLFLLSSWLRPSSFSLPGTFFSRFGYFGYTSAA